MWGKYLVAPIVLITVFHFIKATPNDDGEDDQDAHFTQCDRDVVEKMCEDEMKKEISKCADLMPDDEKPFWFECGKKILGISGDGEWMEMLDSMCSNGLDTVDVAWECMDCWNKKMNESVDEMDDKVYPFKHFDCKDKIWNKALDKTECYCQGEKRPTQPCTSAPKAESSPSSPGK